jgi:hypothetical protein
MAATIEMIRKVMVQRNIILSFNIRQNTSETYAMLPPAQARAVVHGILHLTLILGNLILRLAFQTRNFSALTMASLFNQEQ